MAVANTITTNVILNGVNNLSGPVAKGVSASVSSLDKLSRRMETASYAAMRMGRTLMLGAGVMAAPFIYAGKQALDFEDKMAGVAKVANVEVGSAGFAKLSDEVKDLSVYLGRSAVESADLYVNLAQGGVAVKNLSEIGRLAGEVGVAFNVTSNEAGAAFAHIQNVLGLTVGQTRIAMDAINELSNTRNAPASKILTFLTSGGSGVAQSLKITAKDISAIGSTLIAMGKSGEEAATIMERFAKGINKSASLTKAFKQAGGGAAGIVAILQKGLAQKDTTKFFRGFGEYGNAIELFARTMTGDKGLLNALKTVDSETKISGSVFREYTNAMSTNAAKLRVAWSGFGAVVIDTGEKMMPVLAEVLDAIKPIVASVGQWAEENPKATEGIVEMTGALVELAAAAGALSLAFSGVTAITGFFAKVGGWLTRVASLSTTLSGLAVGFSDLFVATEILGVALGWWAAGLVLLGYGIYKTFEDVSYLYDGFVRLGTGVASFVKYIGPALKALATGRIDEFYRINKQAEDEANARADYLIGENKFQPRKPGYGPGGARPAVGTITNTVPAYLAAPSAPFMGAKTPTASITYSPVMHITGPVTPDSLNALNEAAERLKEDFARQMREFQRQQERKALK